MVRENAPVVARAEAHDAMGKNTNKPVRLPPPPSSGEYEEQERGVKHSKEFEQAELDRLLNPTERPSWDQFKEQQRKKLEAETAETRQDEEAQRKFRAELDEARRVRLGAASEEKAKESHKKKKHHKKHKKESKKGKDEKKHRHKKRRRRDSSSSDSDDSSESSGQQHKKKAKEQKADGPISLRAFFQAGSDDDDD